MNILLIDNSNRNLLFPLTSTRAVADLRIGILTIKERWERLLDNKAFVLTEPYLQPLYQSVPAGEIILIDASVFPSKDLVKTILNLDRNEALHDKHGMIAGKATIDSFPKKIDNLFSKTHLIATVNRVTAPWQLCQWNKEMLVFDFDLLTNGRVSQVINLTNRTINEANIFVEEGAKITHSILNANAGPIYIGKNATIMEGNLIRGPFAMNEGTVLKMGSKIYGATTLGPYCTASGEIKNSILMGYSNKAHDGYLGDSVVGEWCNLGAGTTVSNVKNTGSEVKLWSEALQQFVSTGTKCGVIMGDYSRAAINTSINTGTVIGVCANVFGSGLTPKLIEHFSWGYNGAAYDFEKAISDIGNWKKMKSKAVTEHERAMLKHIFDKTTAIEKV